MAERAGMSTFHSCLECNSGAAMRDRDHRNVLLDGVVRRLIVRSALVIGSKLSALRQSRCNILELVTELWRGTFAEVVAKKVGLIGIERAPAKQVQSSQLTRVSRVEEGTRFHRLDVDSDVQVFLQLCLDVLSYNLRVRQVTACNIAVVQNSLKAIGITGFRE